MYKVIAFFKKSDGLDRQQFIDLYENHHVPVILEVAPPLLYRRNYLVREDSATDGLDFDVMVELGFHDKAGHAAWVAKLGETPGIWDDVPELFHPDSHEIREYVVEEHTS